MRLEQDEARGQQSAAVALGRSRGGFSTKLHIRADASGLPLAFALTGGERHDLTAVPELLDGVRLARTLVIADRGYDADGLRSHLLLRGALGLVTLWNVGALRCTFPHVRRRRQPHCATPQTPRLGRDGRCEQRRGDEEH